MTSQKEKYSIGFGMKMVKLLKKKELTK